MSVFVRLRRFIIPAVIGLLLLIAIAFYNLSVLPGERAYLDERNFRALKTLSNQIFQSINTFDKMVDNATAAGLKSGSLQTYFKNQSSHLEEFSYQDSKPIVGDDYGDPPKIAVATDEGTHFLYLAFKRKELPKFVIRTDLEKLIARISSRCPFDIVVLATADGTVIYQTTQPGIGVARIDALENASGDAKRGKADKVIALDSLSESSRLDRVSIAGATYRLYSQPLQLPFAQADPHMKNGRESDNLSTSKPWILCGLVSDDRFRAESQAFSSSEFLWLSAVILLAITAFPFLKLNLSSCVERVRRFDVVAVAVSTCFAATILTFLFLDLADWKKQQDESRDKQMQDLALAIDKKFGEERQAAFDQLQEFYGNRKLKLTETLRSVPEDSTHNQVTLIDSGKECRPSWACRVNIKSATELDKYPNLLFVTWTDAQGQQVVKWTARDSVTPFLNLDRDSPPYYPAIKRAIQSIGTSDPAPTDGIGSQYSPNTGENITIFWKIFDQDGNPVPESTGPHDKDKKWFCASLIAKPLSVINPILPGGFRFAIVKLDGTVVFHSEPTRNLRENFFAETDQDQEVRARIATHDYGSLEANYMGRPTRLYMRPMDANPNEQWTVVVFRDLRLEESANLDLMCVASILFIYYAALIAMVLLVMRSGGEGRQDRSWFWPDSSKAETYITLVVVNVLAAAAALYLSQLSSLLVVLIVGYLLPACVFALNLAMLRTSRKGDSALIGGAKSSWQLVYTCACASLVLVIAVLPSLACFRVACDFEEHRLIEDSQIKLAADLKDKPIPHWSYAEVLKTTTQSTRTVDLRSISDPSNSSTAEVHLDWVDRLVGWRISLYHKSAADKRFLNDSGPPDVWTQGSSFRSEKHAIVLTQEDQGDRVLRIVTPWQPIVMPWKSWRWWTEITVLMVIFIATVRATLRKLFLFDLAEQEAKTGSIDATAQERLFRRRAQRQKLALVQLAQEGVVNPKARDTLCKLIDENLVGPVKGLLRISDPEFARFLTNAVAPSTIREWEKDGADVRLLSLRTSFIALGICLVVFLIYSQSDVLNTWATFVGGLATLIPVFLRLLDSVGGGNKSEG
jgi:hypothetical protein